MKNMLRLFFSLYFLGQFYVAVGQFNSDSLRTVLETEKTDSATIAKRLLDMESLQTTEQEPFLVLGNWALNQATKLNNKYLVALSNLNLGFSVISTSADFGTATSYFTIAQSIAEENNYLDIVAKALNGLGHIYSLNGQTEKWEEFTLRSIEICKKINLVDGVSAGYSNLSNSYFKKRGEDPAYLDKAIGYLLLSTQTSESIKDSFSLIMNYMSLSRMYSAKKKFDSSWYWLSLSEAYIKGTKRDVDYNRHYYYVGSLYHELGKYPEAIRSYLTSIDYSQKFNIPTFAVTTYKAITKTYKAMGDYRNALHYTEKIKVFDDSLQAKENFAAAADIQNKYQREKKDKELLKKDLQLETASAKRGRLTALFVSSLVVLALLGVFAFILMKHIRARKKAYTQLEEKSIKIQEQAVELSKQARLIAKFQSQMNPHFVFNALHNIQGLVIGQENQKATRQIQSLAQLMRKTFANADKDDIPLQEEVSYLQKYVDFERTAFNNTLDFDIQVNDDVQNVLIPPMMIQPFVENAIKHGDLNKTVNPYIKVLIGIEHDLLSISIRDNGKGIRKGESSFEILSHSMSVIRSRIELLFQGKTPIVNENLFSVKTVPEMDAGTLVKFYLPLNHSY